MRKSLFLFAIAAMLLSCKATNEPKNAQYVDVTVSLAGLDIQITPEDAPRRAPMESDQNATQAKVKRIALNIYDLNGTLIQSETQNYDVDADNFGNAMTFRLAAGSYKFVAVAHAVADATDPVATINSVSEISFGATTVANPTYTTVQDVTISGNTTQSVVIDMGTRKNSSFAIALTDANPAEVAKLQVIASPASTAYTNLVVNPATGLATSQWKYEKTWVFAQLNNFTNTMGKNFTLPLMLTATTQTLDFTINALSATDEVLFTRTLTNVTVQQAHKTMATGTFFSPETTSSFVFDITEIVDNISLD